MGFDIHGQPRGPGRPPKVTSSAEGEPRARVARVPFGAQRQKLTYPPREGYHRHWFNDVANRIQDALAAGYSHVTGSDGKHVSMHGGSHPHGGALTMYLMEIPLEWYEEDQRAKQKIVDEKETAIKRGTLESVEGGYVKTAQITTPTIR